MKKGVFLKQRDVTDCGAVCLASVAAHYGLRIPVSRIRQMAGTDKQGTSLYGLLEAAGRLDFRAKGVRAVPGSLPGIPLPAIFHLLPESGMQHFVVVYRIRKNRVFYMDPAEGKMLWQPAAAFQKTWSGVLLLLMPEPHFRKRNLQTSVFKRFLELLSLHRGALILALLGALVYTVLGLSISVYIEKIIDFVLPVGNRRLMNLLGMIMVAMLICQTGTGYFRSLLALRTGQQIDARLILGYYRHLLRLPQTFFDSMRVGEIISRVHDAVRIRIFINDTALSLVVHALTIFFSLAAMFLYCRKFVLVMTLIIPVYLLLYIIGNRINKKGRRKIMEAGAVLENQLVESIRGIRTVRQFGAEDHFNWQTEKKFVPLMRALYRSGRAGLMLNHVSEFHTRLLTIILLWTGGYFVMDGEISQGALFSFYVLTGYFTVSLQALIGANKNIQDALIAADRLFEIIDLEREKDSASPEPGGLPEGDVEFSNVHFRYGAGNKVFEGLNLVIEQRRITAIVGESGSGKSTLVALLQRLYYPEEGNILIGGTDIRHAGLAVLRRKIAAVPQQTDLFQGTIVSNIALGEEEPDMQRIFSLCERLGLHGFIDQLPGRHHARIHEQGINFSGGQKQRISIARALYRDPEILILDEAGASLDPESEAKVLEALQWFYSLGKTIIVIAHRLSIVKHCHRILLIKDGRLAAEGTHELLMRENKEYAGWWR